MRMLPRTWNKTDRMRLLIRLQIRLRIVARHPDSQCAAQGQWPLTLTKGVHYPIVRFWYSCLSPSNPQRTGGQPFRSRKESGGGTPDSLDNVILFTNIALYTLVFFSLPLKMTRKPNVVKEKLDRVLNNVPKNYLHNLKPN